MFLLAIAAVHAEEVASEDAGLVAACATTNLYHGILAVGGVFGNKHDAYFFLHLVASLVAFNQLSLGHLAQFFVFLGVEQFLAFGNGVKQVLVVMIGFHYGLQVFVVLAKLHEALHVGGDLWVVHLLLNLLIAGVDGF